MITVIACNKLRFKKSSNLDFSIIQTLSSGLQNMKTHINREITSENVDSILASDSIRTGLIKIFNPKDFYNHTLFQLEGNLEVMNQAHKGQKAMVATLNS